jgi:alcohol dehydrogenase, propanol-preferring
MQAMVLRAKNAPLLLEERPDPQPGPGQIRVCIEACAVCRTDLHIIDGELPDIRYPIIPGHEIVGIVDMLGAGVSAVTTGQRVGIPWLGNTCGRCEYCCSERENLCDQPTFTGCNRDGGFATQAVAEATFAIPMQGFAEPAAAAPLLCAGLIGWRSLLAAGEAQTIGLFGFGAAAHIIAQVCRWQGRRLFAFTRPGDLAGQDFARSWGAVWAGSSLDAPPVQLDAAIIFAPAGELLPAALRSVKKGAIVVCAGIHMSDIPSFPYRILWGERRVVSIANLSRSDAAGFFPVVQQAGLQTSITCYPLLAANEAVRDVREGRIQGAAVLLPD